MPDIAIHLEHCHARVEVSSTLLTSEQLQLCLLQLPSTEVEANTDASRPGALAALRDLLVGGGAHRQPALQELAPGLGPVLVAAPEYAFGSGDWCCVDRLVRATARPLVLVGGFGATQGQAVIDWQSAEDVEGTRRHLSWAQHPLGISGTMRVNGGWCWIHDPQDTTHCIVFIKNVLQQSVEAVCLHDMQQGQSLLRLRFADVDVFPLICADLIQPAALYPGSPQARIKAILGNPPGDRPTLILGSLLQKGFNENWAVAVNSLLNDVLAGRRGAVALVNVAHDCPSSDEAADKWRSLTGVFAASTCFPKGQANLPASRALKAQGVVGAVIRQTHAMTTAGFLSFSPYNPVAGAFIWRGNMACRVLSDGLQAPIGPAPEAAVCEIARFLRRHPPAAGSAPRLAEGIAAIEEHLGTGRPPAPIILMNTILHGVETEMKEDADALADAETVSALKAGLHALATVMTLDGVTWQSAPMMTGQLRLADDGRHLLIWRSPNLPRQAMMRRLSQWRLHGDDHPDLVVLGASSTGELLDCEISEDRRDEYTMAPPEDAPLAVGGSLAPNARSFSSSRARRRVATLGLGHVADVYNEYAAALDGQRVSELAAYISGTFEDT